MNSSQANKKILLKNNPTTQRLSQENHFEYRASLTYVVNASIKPELQYETLFQENKQKKTKQKPACCDETRLLEAALLS